MTRRPPTDLARVRNIGIAAHIDAGKTTTTERMLYYAGATRTLGEVHHGTTTMDRMVQEREKGITIAAAAITCWWNDHQVTVIDTPGHVDFTVEVERSLRVLDGAVAVFDAKEGVEPQSEQVWRQADRYGVPRICFVNKMDKLGADFAATVRSLQDRLRVRTLVVQLPLGAESDFRGVVDLVTMTARVWSGDDGSVVATVDVPDDMLVEATAAREALVAALAETDDEIAVRYLEGDHVPAEAVRAAVRAQTLTSRASPVLCGSALANIGVQALLDAVVDYLPSPLDVGPVVGLSPEGEPVVRAPDGGEPFTALAFKVVVHPFFGRLVYLRVYSGSLRAGAVVLNAVSGRKERLTRLFQMQSSTEVAVEEVAAGQICAVVGLKATVTGETLCDPDHRVVLESMTFPEPVLAAAIEPRTRADQDRLALALSRLAEEDPTFTVRTDPETTQTVIGGMGELHLEILVDRMRREFGVDAVLGAPRVAYRETITRVVPHHEHTHRKQVGGRGQYAKVVIGLEPLDTTGDDGVLYEFESRVTGGSVPREWVPAVDAGAQDALALGVLAGYPLVGVKVVLLDGDTHVQDSSDLAFRLAGAAAVREAVARAGAVLLEPVMAVEVVTPSEYVGEVTGDLNARRGRVTDMTERGGAHVVRAATPLREMFGYVGDLRSRTRGRAGYTMRFDRYAPVPAGVAGTVIGR